jgi:3-deoxy-D-manno-octulosonic-acid transferase
MLHQCHRRQIPVIIVNARLTAAAARRYRWIKPLLRPLLASIKLALTQSSTDSQRLIDLGLRPEAQQVVGNLKFDVGELRSTELSHAMQWLAETASNQCCWVAGSTRPGEEEIILRGHRAIQATHPEALLILAPRHIERTAAILEQIKGHGLHSARLSKGPQTASSPTAVNPEVVVLDELGTLRQAYAMAEVCFVGGSLVPLGGHNLIEPAALAKTVISGPHLDNQTEAAQCLEAHQALIRVDDANQLAAEVSALFANPERAQRLGAAAHAAISGHRGSLRATLQALEPVLTRNGLQT